MAKRPTTAQASAAAWPAGKEVDTWCEMNINEPISGLMDSESLLQ